MTDPTTTSELRRIIDEDSPQGSWPDLDALTSAGRRELRRRRIGAGVAAVAVVGALAVPTAMVVGAFGGPDAQGASTSPSGIASSAPGRECGTLICIRPDGDASPETGELLGEPWVINELPSGTEEVIYGVRTPGRDLATGEPAEVNVLKQGYRDDGQLRVRVVGVQPGFEGQSPAGRTTQVRADYAPLGGGRPDQFSVVGYVEGAPDEITWSTPEGEHGPVDGMNTTAVPGYTVFYVVLPLPDGFVPAGYVERHTSEGDVIEINPGDSFPPALTIHTSDGWTCSLEDCGTVG